MRTTMNTDAAETWEQLRAAYAEMEACGIPNYESWFLAGFDVEEARRWASYGWTAGEAWTWIDLVEQDQKRAAAWVAVGMRSPVDPFVVMEATAACQTPHEWQMWRLAGFSHTALVAWRDAGFTDPATASQWAEVGFSPTMARGIVDARALPGRRRPR